MRIMNAFMEKTFNVRNSPISLTAITSETRNMAVIVTNESSSKHATVACVHTVVGKTTVEDASRERVKSTIHEPACLTAEEHFFALCSFVEALSENYFEYLGKPNEWYDDQNELAGGIGLREQFIKATEDVAPNLVRFWRVNKLTKILDTPHEWLRGRFWDIWDAYSDLLIEYVSYNQPDDLPEIPRLYFVKHPLLRRAGRIRAMLDSIKMSTSTTVSISSTGCGGGSMRYPARMTELEARNGKYRLRVRIWASAHGGVNKMELKTAEIGDYDHGKMMRAPKCIFPEIEKWLKEILVFHALLGESAEQRLARRVKEYE